MLRIAHRLIEIRNFNLRRPFASSTLERALQQKARIVSFTLGPVGFHTFQCSAAKRCTGLRRLEFRILIGRCPIRSHISVSLQAFRGERSQGADVLEDRVKKDERHFESKLSVSQRSSSVKHQRSPLSTTCHWVLSRERKQRGQGSSFVMARG